jgi:type IV secretory pathway component VirB8
VEKIRMSFKLFASRNRGFLPQLKSAENPQNEPDSLGVFPTGIRTQALEGRRYLWTTRVFAIAFYLSILLNVILSLTIYSLVPLKKTQPFLVTFDDKKDQVVRIEPFQKSSAGLQLFAEKMASEFLTVRESILVDQEEMQRRWEEILKYRMSEQDFLDFVRRVSAPYQELITKGVNRKVDVTRIERKSADYLEIYFQTNDYDRYGTRLLTKNWVANMRVGFVEQTLTQREQYFNPLGFMVFSYSIMQN